MRLVRLIYVSKTTPSTDLSDLSGLLKKARSKNEELGITGLLCHDREYFVQWLEGPRAAVNELYNTILRDYRHGEVTILEYSEVHQRNFGEWAMGYVYSAHIDKDLVLKYSPTARFDPFEMSAESVRHFLMDFGKRQHENVQNN